MKEETIVRLIILYLAETDPEKRERHFSAIYDAIEEPLRKFLANRAEKVAEDLFQDIILAIVKGLPGFQGKTDRSFFAWCFRIARHKIVDYYRSQGSKRIEFLPIESVQDLLADPRLPAISSQDKLDLEDAMKMLAKLKPTCHILLWEHFINNVSLLDIAARVKLSYDAIRMKIKRCLGTASGFYTLE